jgi:hypothetical protein
MGRALQSAGAVARQSAFRKGAWLSLAGAALIGMGCGRALSPHTETTVVVPVLLLAGLLAVICSFRTRRAFSRVEGIGALVCTVSGVMAGLAGESGPVLFSLAVLGLFAVAALLCRPEAILLAIAAFPWLDWLARSTLGGLGAAWDEVLLLVCAALVLWGAIITGRLRLRTVPALLPIIFVFVAAVASIVVRGVSTQVGVFALRLIVQPMLFYVVGFLMVTSGPWLRRVIGVFLTSTTALALHGLYQYVAKIPTPTSWLDSSETEIVTRAFSVMGKPNELGSILVIGILVALALLLSSGVRRRVRIASALILAIQVSALAVTFSRGAWLGAACGVFALLALAHRRYLLPACLLAGAGVFAAPRVFTNRFLLVFSDDYLSKAAVDGRIYRWNAALDHLAAHPWVGIGLGQFGGSAAQTYGYWALWVDNYYLQLGAEGGVLLLGAFLWLMLRVGKGLLSGYGATVDPFVRALSAGAFGALVAIAATNVFLGAFEARAVAVALWLLAGLTTSAALGMSNDTSVKEAAAVPAR